MAYRGTVTREKATEVYGARCAPYIEPLLP
jgi:hypothetical protein